jgi:hypothetical protein
VGQHSSASGSLLLGLDGFEALAAQVTASEWQLEVRPRPPWSVAWAAGCGPRPWPAHGPGAGLADRWPAGGAGLVQEGWPAAGGGWPTALGPRWPAGSMPGPRLAGPGRHGGARPLARVRQRPDHPAGPCQGGGGPTSTPSGWPTRWSIRSAAGPSWPPLGHRGRKPDPLYRIRKLLLTAAEQLTQRGRGPGYGPGSPPVTLAVRWRPLGRARSCCGPSIERSVRRRPAPPWTASTAGAMASRSPEPSRLARTVRVWEAEILAFHATNGCPNGPTEAVDLLVKKVKGSGTASVTSPTIGYACYCTAASGGRLTEPQGCEAAPRAW